MLLCVIKRGWIVFSIGLLSACGSGSVDPEPEKRNPDPGSAVIIPATPATLKTEAKSGINLLSWDAQQDVSYTLYNRLISEPSSSWVAVESNFTETSYEHSITDSYLYEYAVSAVNSAGESSKRSETTVIPQLWIDSLSKKEGDEGVTTPFEFEITLNRAATKTVTVSYKTVADSATEDDYSPVNDSEIEIPVGETVVPFSITVIGDADVESDESFYIRLSDEVNVTLGSAEATATILNDDEPPTPEITELSPLSATLNTETEFTVKGQFLTDKIRLEIDGCSSPVLLEGGNNSQQQFRCTLSVSGQKSARVLSANNEILKTFEIEVQPGVGVDTVATGSITQPIADESYEGDIDIAANATDEDGLKKVSVNFSASNKKVILCSGDCAGDSDTWATKINPAAYYDSSNADITLGLWVLDMNDKNIKVDEVTFQWQPLSKNDSLPLNDTGVTKFYNSENEVDEEPLDFPGQDASFGRDVVAAYNEDGHAGFSFTKIDSNGDDLPASALEWSCVRDNVTGLIWESKTDDGGLHDKDERFSWWKGDGRGEEDKFRECNGYTMGVKESYCNTEAYTVRVNSTGLCGLHQWRLPMKRELVSLINSGQITPAIDINWFPNTSFDFYWAYQQSSGIPGSGWDLYSWGVNFNEGHVDGVSWQEAAAIRLVHPAQ